MQFDAGGESDNRPHESELDRQLRVGYEQLTTYLRATIDDFVPNGAIDAQELRLIPMDQDQYSFEPNVDLQNAMLTQLGIPVSAQPSATDMYYKKFSNSIGRYGYILNSRNETVVVHVRYDHKSEVVNGVQLLSEEFAKKEIEDYKQKELALRVDEQLQKLLGLSSEQVAAIDLDFTDRSLMLATLREIQDQKVTTFSEFDLRRLRWRLIRRQVPYASFVRYEKAEAKRKKREAAYVDYIYSTANQNDIDGETLSGILRNEETLRHKAIINRMGHVAAKRFIKRTSVGATLTSIASITAIELADIEPNNVGAKVIGLACALTGLIESVRHYTRHPAKVTFITDGRTKRLGIAELIKQLSNEAEQTAAVRKKPKK